MKWMGWLKMFGTVGTSEHLMQCGVTKLWDELNFRTYSGGRDYPLPPPKPLLLIASLLSWNWHAAARGTTYLIKLILVFRQLRRFIHWKWLVNALKVIFFCLRQNRVRAAAAKAWPGNQIPLFNWPSCKVSIAQPAGGRATTKLLLQSTSFKWGIWEKWNLPTPHWLNERRRRVHGG